MNNYDPTQNVDVLPIDNDTTAKKIREHVGLANEDEMAAILQVSHETLATWRSKRKGPPSIKLGKKVFYLVDGFGKWVMAECEKQADRPYTPRRNKTNGQGKRKPMALVHVDEDKPGVHVEY